MMTTISMRARDGVRLDADVYRPDAAGTYPVLLMRQPYGRAIASTLCYAHPQWYAAQGYIVVIQDVRGRGTSEGTFRLFADDASDGVDTIAWAAALAGANGAVGMYGFSYQGTNQLLTAAQRPAALRALAPAMIGWDVRTDWAYENGAFCLRAGLGWAVQIAAETARLAGDAAAFRDLAAAATALPLADLVPARPSLIERYRAYTHYFDWIDRPHDDSAWRSISPSAHADTLAAHGPPMLFIGGWYDTHLRGTLDAHHAVAAAGHVPTRLVIGPWAHSPWTRRVGGRDFGPEAIGEIDHAQIRWFDRWLKGADNGAERDARLRIFDLGANCWRNVDKWPHETLRYTLTSTGRAAIDERAGVLTSDAAPSNGVATEYLVHDPWRPAPTLGGAYGTPPGPFDRSVHDQRPDILTFTTAPLTTSLTFAGEVAAELAVTADTPSFDVACTLARVTADGRSYELTSGYVHVAAATDGDVLRVPMRATCAKLAPGEALRLAIGAASYPAYPVNPGTGADPTAATRADARVITLAVRVGGDRASSLLLTLIPTPSSTPYSAT